MGWVLHSHSHSRGGNCNYKDHKTECFSERLVLVLVLVLVLLLVLVLVLVFVGALFS